MTSLTTRVGIVALALRCVAESSRKTSLVTANAGVGLSLGLLDGGEKASLSFGFDADISVGCCGC